MGDEVPAHGFLDVEDADVELARGGDLRVLLAHGARGGVARVGKQRLASELALGVELLEHRAGHVDLTADDEPLRGVFEFLRQVPHGAEVLGDVLAGHAVAARSAADEYAVFQRHGEAVYLRLRRVFAPLRQGGEHALVKFAQFVKGEHVVEALERHLVRHGRKGALGRAAHLLRGRRWRVKLRVRGLQLLEPAH